MSVLGKYYVLEPNRGQTRVAHDTYNEAETEAVRLLKANPTQTFCVLHVVSECFKRAPITINKIGVGKHE